MRLVTSYQQYRVKQGKIFIASCIGMLVGAEGVQRRERERERERERKRERKRDRERASERGREGGALACM